MVSERPIGALLSGGLDSSLICGIAAKILEERGCRLTTFTIGMEKDAPDVQYARTVAKYINSIHHEIILPVDAWIESIPYVIRQIETYDITTVRASCAQYLISKWISENTDVKVILNGDFSDEITSGYLYFFNAPSVEESHQENIRLLNEIHFYDCLRVDRGISAFGIEARVPFACHHFVDLYLSIDKELRAPIKGIRDEKNLLREAFDDGSISSIIPYEVLWRQKEAMSDGISNQRKSWFEYIEEFIEDKVKVDNDTFEKNIFRTKESYWYYKIYKEFYPDSDLKVNFWQPKWCNNENKHNPSARVLKSLY
jgi:asparagine synthase (glutamine-hydrolysing)